MKILHTDNLLKGFGAAALALIAGTFFSCSIETTSSNGFSSYDDIYTDEAEVQEQENQRARLEGRNVYQDKRFTRRANTYSQALRQQETQAYTPDTLADAMDTSYYQNYAADDYYDNAYTARIRRFHSVRPLYDYYDDYYTDYALWDYDPYYWSGIYTPAWDWRWGWAYRPWSWSWSYSWGYHPWGWYHWDYYDWGWHHNYGPWHNGFGPGHNGFGPGRDIARGVGGGFNRPNDGSGRLGRGNNGLNGNNGGPGYRGEPAGGKTTGLNNGKLARGNAGFNGNNGGLQQQGKRLEKPASRQRQLNLNNGNIRTLNQNGNGRPAVANRQVNPSNNTLTKGSNDRRMVTTPNTSSSRTYTPPTVRQQRSNDGYRRNTEVTSQRRTLNSERSLSRPSSTKSTSSFRSSSPSRSSSSSSRSFSSPSRSSSSSHSSGSSSHSGSFGGGGGRAHR